MLPLQWYNPSCKCSYYIDLHVVDPYFYSDYWGYFEPIRQFMPKNCSADVEAVISHIDSVFSGKNQKLINQTLALFGLSDLRPHLDDAAGARMPCFL